MNALQISKSSDWIDTAIVLVFLYERKLLERAAHREDKERKFVGSTRLGMRIVEIRLASVENVTASTLV